jgi:hypothetical protein
LGNKGGYLQAKAAVNLSAGERMWTGPRDGLGHRQQNLFPVGSQALCLRK